jgi:hypothetical protein
VAAGRGRVAGMTDEVDPFREPWVCMHGDTGLIVPAGQPCPTCHPAAPPPPAPKAVLRFEVKPGVSTDLQGQERPHRRRGGPRPNLLREYLRDSVRNGEFRPYLEDLERLGIRMSGSTLSRAYHGSTTLPQTGDASDVAAGRCCPHCRGMLTDHNRAVWNAGYAMGQRHADEGRARFGLEQL